MCKGTLGRGPALCASERICVGTLEIGREEEDEPEGGATSHVLMDDIDVMTPQQDNLEVAAHPPCPELDDLLPGDREGDQNWRPLCQLKGEVTLMVQQGQKSSTYWVSNKP